MDIGRNSSKRRTLVKPKCGRSFGLYKLMLGWLTNFGVSRFFSLVIAAGYLSIVLFTPGIAIQRRLGVGLALAGYLLLPLLCIWYGDEMGNYTGTRINKATPGCLVKAGGWVLLVLPAILPGIAMSIGAN